MIRDKNVREKPTSKLMKMAYYMFNFASVQSYKWKFNKGDPPDVRNIEIEIMVVVMAMTKTMTKLTLMKMMIGRGDDDDKYDDDDDNDDID